MIKQKQAPSWNIAATHWVTANFIPWLIVMTFVYIPTVLWLGENSPIPGLVILAVMPLVIWLGTRYAANYVNSRYVMRDKNRVIQLAVTYMVLWTLVNWAYGFYNGIITPNVWFLLPFVSVLASVLVFYKTSQQRIAIA